MASPMTVPSDNPLHTAARTPREISPMLAAGIILLAGLAVYSNSFSGAFVFDDNEAIVANSAIRRLWPPWRFLAPGNRPVVNLTLAVNYAVGRLDVAPYHALNLAVHVLAALTLFGLVRRTLTLPALRARFEGASVGLALAVALIWEIHPLQTESVTYIIQRAESLAGLFYLLTLYCAMRGAFSGRSWRWYAAAAAACALGMESKETMVTAPIIVLLYDRAFLSGSFREAIRRRWGAYLALAATWLLLLPSAATAVGDRAATAGFQFAVFTPLDYAATQPGVILHYLRLSFWPHPLCLDYFWPVARTVGEILPGAIVVGCLLAATAAALAYRAKWGFLGAWFFLILAPTSSVMPIADAAVEHRMYLPLAAVVASAAVGLYLLGERLLRRRAETERLNLSPWAALVLLIAAALGFLTFRRNADYRTELSIWEDTVRKRPADPRAYNSRGLAYFQLQRVEQAIRDYDSAIELAPDYAAAYNSRAIACDRMGRYDDAIRDCDRAIGLNPDFAIAYNTRAVVRARKREYAEAIRDFGKAVALKPDYAAAYRNRGDLYSRTGERERAVEDYDRAIALMPDYAAAYCSRGNLYAGVGAYDQAIRDYDRAIALQPDYRDAYNNRAASYYLKKEYRRAWADVQALRRLGGEPPAEFLQALTEALPPPE